MSNKCDNFFFYWSDIAEKSFGKKKTLSLSVFQKKFEFVCFPVIFEILRKKRQIFAKFAKIWWEKDKLKIFLESRQTQYFFLTKNFFGNI